MTATTSVLKARDAALEFLHEAEAALDQAHAQMRDAHIDCYTVDFLHYGVAVVDLRNMTARMVTEVETAECGECCAPLHDGPCAPEVEG